MHPNTAGTADTTSYNLGRGRIYFAALVAGIPIAWRDMGNAPEFTITGDEETLQHFSSRGGLKQLDKEVTLTKSLGLTFKLDELTLENLAALFSGTSASVTNGAVAGFAEYNMIVAANVAVGHWYDIKNSTGVRCYDIRATDLVVKSSNATPVTLVKDTDYTVDLVQGRIFLLSSSSAVATIISNGENVRVSLAAHAAGTITEVRALAQSAITGALKFIAENPANNDEQTEIQFHQVTLKADGDTSLIGDDWSQLPFKATAEKNTTYDANSPTMSIRYVAKVNN